MFDAHAHLQDSRLDHCRMALLTTARCAGINDICCCATSPQDWPAVATLAAGSDAAWPRIWPGFAVHPWFAGALPETWLADLELSLLKFPRAVVGECGLDGTRRCTLSPELQRQVLQQQLNLAVTHGRPAVLHGAGAWGALLETVRPLANRLPAMVAHSFGGSLEIMRQWLKLGGYISLSGTVCNPAAKRAREAATAVPLERLLVESDAPDLFPYGGDQCPLTPSEEAAGNRPLNHPANLRHVIATIASLRGMESQTLAALTATNARRALAAHP